MSERKYYVKSLISCEPYTSDADKGWLMSASNDSATWIYKKYRTAFTKSELAEIMDGVLYRTFTHQFHPQLAEELYKLGYRTTQTTDAVVAALFSVSAVVNLAYHHYGDIAILVFMALVLIIWATVMFYCMD